MCVVYLRGGLAPISTLVGVARKWKDFRERTLALANRTEWGALFKVKEVLAAESFSR